MLERFLNDNSVGMRFARTVVQGIIAALIVFVPDAIGMVNLDPSVAALLTATIMAILSPAMALLKASDTIECDDSPDDDFIQDDIDETDEGDLEDDMEAEVDAVEGDAVEEDADGCECPGCGSDDGDTVEEDAEQ